MLTLERSMELAGTNLLNTLSPHDNYLPFWSLKIDRDMRAQCNLASPEHNIGRWWDALLRLEAATGFAIPAEMEAAMLLHLENCLDNPLSICGPLNKKADCFDHHSQREVLLALAGLVRYRDSEWATATGTRMIRALDRYIDAEGTWNIQMMSDLARRGERPIEPERIAEIQGMGSAGVVLASSHGRMIEGLVEFHSATGSEDAIRLADRLARFHLEATTLPDGSVPDTEGYVHTHSLFGTYRGLLMYGRLTRQHEYIERIARTYALTVRTHVKQSGFISHDWGSDNRGETTSPGDAAQLALWLAQFGYSEFLDDAERIVRARILPSQITAPLGLKPAADDEDEHANLDDRAIGAFGGMHRHPHGGKRPTTDITAADLHTLCDIFTHIVEETGMGLVVNFHFDYEDGRIRVEDNRGDVGRLAIQLKVAQPVSIRIPGWASMESIRLAVNGQPSHVSRIGNFLFVPRHEPPVRITVEYGLPVQTIDESTDGVDYRITWRGDDVIGIAPNTDFLPFYATASE